MLEAAGPVVELDQYHEHVAARMPTQFCQIADTPIADDVGQAGERRQECDDDTGANEPSRERDEVVGWGYDEESAIKVAQALNLAERPYGSRPGENR